MTVTNAREDGHRGDRAMRGRADGFPDVPVGDIDIRIARDGTWYHEGRAIRRPRLVKLFASILTREANGAYCLVTPAEKRCIVVEDAPFVAVEVAIGDGGVRFRTNVDEFVTADGDHPIRVETDRASGRPLPYVHVRDGLDALIARSVYYELVKAGRVTEREGRMVMGIDSAGCFFVLGEIGDDS